MTAAQKAAKANFKKAIEYRKKTGVSLKEAFAHVYGKKVGAAPKKKAAKKAAPKKAAPKKAARKVVKKKAAPKKVARKVESVHKDTKSHNVNIRVISGLSKIIGVPHKSKYYITYKKFETKYNEYFDKLPKDRYLSPSDRIVYVMRNTDNGTALVPLRYTKNEMFVKK
jgi:hypothetical protein